MTKNLLPRLDFLDQLAVGSPLRYGAVTVLPVFSQAAPARADYRLACEALADGALEIHEASAQGVVGMLEARNRGGRRVLIVEGDHLIGAKQNRMLTSSALVGARQHVHLPASCVEQGRWHGPSGRFANLATMAPASLRRIAKLSVTRAVLADGSRAADQQRIWSTIADQQRRLQVDSSTRALSHTFAERAHEVEDAALRLPHAADAIGLAVGIAGELISIDVFDHPATCAHYWRRIVEGAVLEGLTARGRGGVTPLGPDAVRALVAASRAGLWSPVRPVGDGHEHRARLDGDAAGSLLGLDGKLVHFGVVTRAALDSTGPVVTRYGYLELPPELARRYRIVERIGVGGTKEVFRATVLDAPAGTPDVAIARMPFVDDVTFDREIAVVRRVRSAYVPQIHETFVDDQGDGYLVMERCDGPNLATVLAQRGGALPVAEAAPILLAFARGLREIHDAAVLHRDIKLENAMLARTPTGDHALKIIDFGLSARAACASTSVGVMRFGGTIPYMSPEVLRGLALDARADVYAFGVCCFRLLAGDFPAPPKDHESELEYMQRLVHLERHDLSRLPPLPPPATQMLHRMLDMDPERRPLMPEVVAAFERAFGGAPLRAPRAATPSSPSRAPQLALVRATRIVTPVASPEHVIVAPCMQAPIVVLAPDAASTKVDAYRLDGTLRWSRRLDGRFTAGLRADLDGDGMRELHLAGPDRFAVLGASGSFKLARDVPAYAPQPSLVAITDSAMPRLAIDGRLIDPSSGAELGTLAYTYQGNGRELVPTDDRRGIAFNGFALQSFRGTHATAAAIVFHPGDDGFLVAHLEEARTGPPRVQLAVYGPGGACRHTLPIAEGQLDTGDTGEIHRLLASSSPLFTSACSPLAVLGPDRTAVVIVPLLSPDPAVPRTLAAFELPSGRPLWRTTMPPGALRAVQLASTRSPVPGVHYVDDRPRAILADVDGDGRPELVVGDGANLVAYDPWTGAASEPVPCTGVPVAFGDPFASGFAHLIVASHDGVELLRGPPTRLPGTMQWSGPRGDLWRTGTLRADGLPLGPL